MLGLAAACYLDPAHGTAEREKIFDRSWQFVCHESDLPAAGTAIRFDCGGRSAVVLRGRDGLLHGFRNVCRHRGSRLVDGDAHTGLAFCVDAHLRCPYHGWTYDEYGTLISVPSGQQYQPSELVDASLQTVQVTRWHGFVFIAFEAATPLEQAIGGPHEHAALAVTQGLRRLGEPRIHALRADWKLACELLLDRSYRAIARPALQPNILDAEPFVPHGALAVRAVCGMTAAGRAASWPVRAYAASLPASLPRRAETIFVWPNLLLSVMPDQLAAIQVLPATTGNCTLREVSYGYPDPSGELRLARYAASRVRRRARSEDVRILERVQEALGTGAPDYAGPISSGESGVQWFLNRLRATGVGASAASAKRRSTRKPALMS